MMKCRFECLSTRNSILPPLMSLTALATSGVTVPVFGFGIRPRGPSTRPRRPTLPMRSGVATTASKSRRPFGDLVDQLVGADDVGARGLRGRSTVTGREDQDPGGLAGAVREVHGATDHLVGLARVDTQAEGDLDGARRTWSWRSPWRDGRPRAGRRAAPGRSWRPQRGEYLLRFHFCSCVFVDGCRGDGAGVVVRAGAWPCHGWCWRGGASALDRDAHGTGGAGDDLLGAGPGRWR